MFYNLIRRFHVSVEQGRGNIWWTIGIVGGIALAIIVVGLILNKMPKKE